MDMSSNDIEHGEHNGMILKDLQMTSNDHKRLSGKMNCIGFLGKLIKWFHYYLTEPFFV